MWLGRGCVGEFATISFDTVGRLPPGGERFVDEAAERECWRFFPAGETELVAVVVFTPALLETGEPAVGEKAGSVIVNFLQFGVNSGQLLPPGMFNPTVAGT